ncbi:MAG TPA: hypothetical protein VND65_15955, partial [Candidatus Binatia bacterium]|nr:hypothetical protein [Candidatus Binatia bacterium]
EVAFGELNVDCGACDLDYVSGVFHISFGLRASSGERPKPQARAERPALVLSRQILVSLLARSS